MARVPTYDGPQVGLSGGGVSGFSNPGTEGFDAPGRQLQQFGRSLSAAGEAFGDIVLKEQEQANDLKVIEAENRAREEAIRLTVDQEEGFANVLGGDVANRASGKSLGAEYGEKYQRSLDGIAAGLTNDAQRAAFARSAMLLRRNFDTKVSEHEFKEYRSWSLSVVKGSAELAAQEIALNYNDTDAIDRNLSTLDVSVAKAGGLNGLSGNEITALQRTARSSALGQAIAGALDRDELSTASALFERYGKDLLAPEKVKLEATIRRETDARYVMNLADRIEGAAPDGSPIDGVEPASIEKVFASLVQQESGGRVGIPGPLTKYGRAYGLTQVLDATGKEVAQELGIAWRPDLMRGKSREAAQYQLKIGRAYFEKGLRKYGGDYRKALMFYHGGPNEKIWGPKTRGYAAAVLKRAGGVSSPDGTAIVRGTLGDALKVARTAILEERPDAPVSLIKAVEEEVERRWRVREADEKDRESAVLDEVYTTLNNNGGDVNALPANLRNAIPGDQWDSVRAFARGVRSDSQSDRWSDPRIVDGVYNLAISQPHLLKASSDASFLRTYAGHPQFNELARYRAELRGAVKSGKDTAGSIAYESINRTVDNRLMSVGLDPKSKDEDDQAQAGRVRRFVSAAVASEQRRLGRQLNDVEIENLIDRQFALEIPLKSGDQVPVLSLTPDQLNDAQVRQLDEILRSKGIPQNDENRMQLFYTIKSRGG